MSPSAENHTMLATKRPQARARRSIKASDFALPKPYRKKRFVEDEPEVPKMRVAAVSLGGVLIACLVAALALLVKENLDTPPVLVVAAPPPAAAPPTVAASVKLTARPARQLREPWAVAAPAQPMAAARARVDFIPSVLVGGHFMAVPGKSAHMAHMAAAPEPAEPDPDVVLISTILMLTPPPEAEQGSLEVCTSADAMGCAAIHGMVP